MHTPTLFLVNVALSIVVSITLFCTGHRRHPELYIWAAAIALHATGYALGGLRGQIGDVWSIVVGNTVITLALALLAEGVYQFQKRTPPRRLLWLPIPFTLLTFAWFIDNLGARLLLSGVIVSFQIMLILHPLLARHRQTAGRGQYIMVLGFLMSLGGMLFRVIQVLANHVPKTLFDPSPYYSSIFFGNLLALLLVTVGMIMMVQENTLHKLLITEQRNRRLLSQVRRLAYRDELTHLPNRRALTDQLQQAATSRRGTDHGHLALLFIDLDHFKALNDRYGHLAGDEVLKEVARRLRGHIRKGDTVARLGGDEFVVLLNNLDEDYNTAREQVLPVAAEMLKALNTAYILDTGNRSGRPAPEHHCTASIGIHVFKAPDAAAENLLDLADTAMYQAKKSGRGAICFVDQIIDEST